MDKTVSHSISQVYADVHVKNMKISRLATKYMYSELIEDAEEVVKRGIINRIIDKIHLSVEGERSLIPGFYIIPETFSIERRRIPLYIVGNYLNDIFSIDRNYRRDVLLRTIGMSMPYYKLDARDYFQFANINQGKEDKSHVILSRMSVSNTGIFNFLGAYKRIALSQIYLESVSSRLYVLEESINLKDRTKILRMSNISAFEDIYELESLLEYNTGLEKYNKAVLGKLDQAYIAIPGKRRRISHKSYISGIDREAGSIIRRLNRILTMIKETRDYKNVTYNYDVQSLLKVLTFVSILIGVLSLGFSLLAITSSENTYTFKDLIITIKHFLY